VLGVGAGVALFKLINSAVTFARRVICVLLFVGLGIEGISFPSVTLLNYDAANRRPFSDQMIRPYLSNTYPVDRDDARAVSFLRTHAGPSAMVYRAERKSEPYAVWGGLQLRLRGTCVRPKRMRTTYTGSEKRSLPPGKRYRPFRRHVTWVVADAEDATINAALDSPQGQLSVVQAAQYGGVRVFHFR
jgi:hypothetical protein